MASLPISFEGAWVEKKECLECVEFLSVSWDKPLDPTTMKMRASAYWEYIEDLPLVAVKETIKNMAISGRQWAPKPGELRVATIGMIEGVPMPPVAEEAWTELMAIRGAIYGGTTNYEKAGPVLASTMRRLGEKATTLHTVGDRDMFLKLYNAERERHLLDRFGNTNED